MSGHPPDPDFLDRPDDLSPDRSAGDAPAAALEHDGAPGGHAGDPTGSCGDCSPAEVARALAESLAAAELDCARLAARLERAGPAALAAVQAAQRCRVLMADALLLGAVELAVQLGVPDEELPR